MGFCNFCMVEANQQKIINLRDLGNYRTNSMENSKLSSVHTSIISFAALSFVTEGLYQMTIKQMYYLEKDLEAGICGLGFSAMV